jgi:uncharacterized membrane protein
MSIAQISTYFKKVYQKTINSIAFYPTVLAVGMLGLAWLCLFIDSISYGSGIIKFFSFLVVKNMETARSLLSILAGGLISLMVFSFSMVMIVLNQAASNYSPRVLPGLVSKREHQIVLGIYIGTIGYTLAVLSNVHSETFELLIPRFSIIINLLLGVGCFAAFIYFIHDISTTIQVGNILKRLYNQTCSVLTRELSAGNYSQEVKEFAIKQEVEAWQSGYFFSVMEKAFLEKAGGEGLRVKILVNQGQYLLKGEPFLAVNQLLTEELHGFLRSTFTFRHQEMISDNFFYGFKQITEVAAKALSPGINDPGTAVQALDYLSALFQMLLKLKGQRVLRLKEGVPVLFYLPVPYQEIFYMCTASLRNYAEKDLVVQAKLISLIKKTAEADTTEGSHMLYQSELDATAEIAEKSFKSHKDIRYIHDLIKGVKQLKPEDKKT